MYLISDETRSLLSNNYRQIVKITCNGLENTFELTESNIAQGGLSINRYCVSGDKIEIGSAVASELTLKLDNRDDRFSETVFEGAELQAQLGIKKWDAYRWENAQIQWIPLGYFTVDETPRKLSYITLSALDRMVRFDKEVTEKDITFPIKISSLLSVCCANCNVPLKTIPTSLLNADYIVTKFPDYDELTYRRLIQWIAEISGTCAFVDWNGELCLSGYSLDNDFSLTPSDRYSSDMYEQDITITGVQISDDDDNVYLAGTDDYAFNIENNGLIQSNHLEIATAIFNKVKDIVYRPYTCTCKPLPYVYPLDGVSYTDKNGIVHKSIVTGITFKMNASTTLEGKGETQTKNGYASANPLTKAESVVLKKLENRVNRKISNYEQASLDMNEIISNSLGLYRTEVVEENGSTTYYYHDATTLEDSAIIYTFNAGGFAWTTEWEGAETVWNYGITKDGNAVYNILSAFKIQSELLETGCITTDKIKVGAIGGFEIDETHIGYGKSAYNDKNNGVYLSPNGIGLGAGKFYVSSTGKLVADDAEIIGAIKGGTININDNFIVDESGNVQLNGNISWGTGTSPTQVLYARTALEKPGDNVAWSDFPNSSINGWHTAYSILDYYASFTYDGGKTWGNAIQVVGKNGTNGANGSNGDDGSDGDTIQIVYLYYRKTNSSAPSTPSYTGGTVPSGWSLTPKGTTSYYKYEFISQCTVTNGSYGTWSTPVIWAKYGVDGSDATVTDENVFNALTSNGTMYGCFTALNNKLYINAAYIKAGTVSSDITFTGKLVADDAQISGHISATSGAIGGWYIGVNDGYLRSATGVYGTYSWTTTGADLRYASGYRFVALTELGFMYVLKSGSDYDNSATIVVASTLNNYGSTGGSTAGSGGTIYL